MESMCKSTPLMKTSWLRRVLLSAGSSPVHHFPYHSCWTTLQAPSPTSCPPLKSSRELTVPHSRTRAPSATPPTATKLCLRLPSALLLESVSSVLCYDHKDHMHFIIRRGKDGQMDPIIFHAAPFILSLPYGSIHLI